jgi:flagellar basal-body rod protein FlgG
LNAKSIKQSKERKEGLMDAALWVSKTGLDAQQMRMNVISNNLANVNTTGFKRDRAVFEDLLYQNVRQAGGQTTANTQSPTGLMLGTGVKVVATEKIAAQGNMINTQNSLDLAITGDGHFQITQQDGTLAYSRDGNFKISSTGQVVTANGALLQPPITIPNNASSVTVGLDGTVSAELNAGGGQQNLGVIQIARFINPSGLTPIGNNLMTASAASGQAQVLQPGVAGAGKINQGSLEASNVNVVEEMVNMIETQRAYEINSKSIAAVDGMLKFLNQNM